MDAGVGLDILGLALPGPDSATKNTGFGDAGNPAPGSIIRPVVAENTGD
jgi:hypothetical protein